MSETGSPLLSKEEIFPNRKTFPNQETVSSPEAVSRAASENRKTLSDPRRLARLEASALLDTAPEESFDRFTRLAAKMLGVPVALVSLVAGERQFFKSCFGLGEPLASERQTPLSHSLCQYVVIDEDALIVEDARLDDRLCDNLAIRDFDVIAYLGMPLRTADGTVFGSLCAIDTAPREWSDEEIEVLRDLAASASSEIELRTLSRDLQESHLELRQREVEREELRQLLVHDMRNPLTSLIGGLRLVELSDQLDEREAENLELALESADGLLRLIDGILDLDKSESGRLRMADESLDPGALAGEAHRQMRSLAEISQVALELELSGPLPEITGDRSLLVRMLVNLLSNAIRHTPAGGRVVLSAGAEHGHLFFEVRDTGCGIPENAFDLIFEKFGQVEARISRPSSTGLGLPSSKMVVNAHGGEIDVESELGQGTTFRVRLPSAD